MNFDLVLCGVGGQGVLSMAYVVDHAALDAGLHVKQPEVHGMAQRGGAVSAQVRLSTEAVRSDLISTGEAGLVLSVEPMEALRYTRLLRPDGWIVTDVTPLKNIGNYPDLPKLYDVLFRVPNLVAVDASRLASHAGVSKGQNMVAMGAAASHLPISAELLEKHVTALFAPRGERVVAANLDAFRRGRAASAFADALRAKGLSSTLVARVTSRVDFTATVPSDEVVEAWTSRLKANDGATWAERVFASRDLLAPTVEVPRALA